MYQNLQSGDSLFRRKGAVVHQGVYLINGLVAHQGSAGLRVESLEVFANGQEMWVQSRPVPLPILLERLSQIGADIRPYNVFSNNCEHFATSLQRGAKGSQQLEGGLAGGIAGLCLAFASDSSLTEAALFALVCSFIGVQAAKPRR